MSAATADFLDYWTGRSARRWIASLILVLVLHLGVAGGILFRHGPTALSVNPPQVPVLLDLPPLPAVPMNMHPLPVEPLQPKVGLPTSPLQQQAQPQPQQQPQAQPQPQVQTPSPPTTPSPQPENTSPLLPPTTTAAEPRIIVPPPPDIADTPAPPKSAAPIPSTQAASLPILPMPNAQEDSMSAWQRKVLARLYSLNRIPAGIPTGESSATADVLMNVDRNGHIVYFKIVKSSGYPTLDHAIRSLMRHADPLPPPPAGPIDILNAPQQFTLTIGYGPAQ